MRIIALPDLRQEINHLEAIADNLSAVDLVLLGEGFFVPMGTGKRCGWDRRLAGSSDCSRVYWNSA